MGKTLLTTVLFFLLVFVISGSILAEPEDVENIQAHYGFDEMEIIKLDWDIGNLCIADFNGDGLMDIAVVNNRKSKIELLIQEKDPNHSSATVESSDDRDINELTYESRFSRQELPLSVYAANLCYGDFNSDGLTDLAFYGKPNALYVVLQKADKSSRSDKKTLSWQRRRKIKINDGLLDSKSILCGDLNADGKDDIVLAAEKAIYLIAQNDKGQLAEPVKYPTTARPLIVTFGDLNGDGRGDLVLLTNDRDKPLHVRFGMENGQLSPQHQFFIVSPGRAKSFMLFDYDNDGADEIFIVEGATGRLTGYRLQTQSQEDDAQYPILFYPLEVNRESLSRDIAVGDFDGNGLSDIVISDPGAAEVILYRQEPGLGLTEPIRFPAFSDIVRIQSKDIDGDGKYELAILSIKEKAIGISKFEDERFSFAKPIKLATEPVAMELADIDSDSRTDCLYITKDNNDVFWLSAIYDLSNNSSPGESVRLTELKGLKFNPEGIKAIDVDHDWLLDVIVFVSKYDPPILVRQVEKGRFEVIDSPDSRSSLIKNATINSIAVADVDGNLGDELLVTQRNFARSLVFKDGLRWDIIDQYNARSTEDTLTAVAAFDIDADGATEILLLDGQKGKLQILKADKNKTYRFEKELETGQWNAGKIGFAKLTADPVESILLFDDNKFALITPGGNPLELEDLFSYETQIQKGKYGRLTLGDINSDGRVDIIMVEKGRNHIEILALDNELKPTPAMRFKIFEEKSYRDDRRRSSIEPRELKVADVTGDGHNDLVTIIHDRIIIYPQDF